MIGASFRTMCRRSMRSLLAGSLAALACVVCTVAPAAAAGDKDVTVVLQEEPPSMEPCNSNTSIIGKVLKQNVIESLVDRNVKTGKLVPRLATSWDHPNDHAWIFHLRKNVKFHDGADFNSDAVIKAIDRTMDTRLDCQVRIGVFNDFKMKMTAVDPYTLKIVTNKPTPILPTRFVLLGIMSPNTPSGVMSNDPIGTGPYEFVKRIPGQEIDLKRFDGYWGKKPQVEHAKFIWRSESSVRAAMVKRGEADLAPNISQDDATSSKIDIAYPNSETTWLRIEVDRAPLNDIRVRKALNLAIDRKALRGTVFPKEAEPATQLDPPGTVGFNPNLKVWPYDPAKARKLLAAAKADGVPVGKQITIYGRIGIYPHSKESLEAIMGMLQNVGFNIKLQMNDVAEQVRYIQKPFPKPIVPNLLQDSHDNADGDVVFTMFYKFDSKGANSVLNNPKLDKLISEATAATGEKRVKLWNEAYKLVYHDMVAYIPLFHMVGFARVGSRINYQPSLKTNSEVELSTITFK